MQDAMMLLAVIIPQVGGNAIIVLSVSFSVTCRLPWTGCEAGYHTNRYPCRGQADGCGWLDSLRVFLAILKIPVCKIESRGACRCFGSRRWRQGLEGGDSSSSRWWISLTIPSPLTSHEHTG